MRNNADGTEFWAIRVLNRICRRPWQMAVFCLLWIILASAAWGGLSWACDNLIANDNCDMGMLDDTVQLGVLCILPLCFLVLYYARRRYHCYVEAVPDLLTSDCPRDLQRDIQKEAGQALVVRGRTRTFVRIILGIGVVLVLWNTISNTFPAEVYGKAAKWDGIAHPVTYAFNRLYIALTWGYLLPVWVCNLGMLMTGMCRTNRALLDSGYLKVSPFRSSGGPGIAKAGKASLWLTYMVLSASPMLVAPIFRDAALNFGHYLMLALLGPATVVLAIVPVLSLHKGMKRRKAELIGPISREMDEITSKAERLIYAHDSSPEVREQTIRALQPVLNLYEHIERMPTWPFNSALVRRLAIASIAPILALAAKLIANFALS